MQPDLNQLYFLQDAYGFAWHSSQKQWAFVQQWGETLKSGSSESKGNLLSQPRADLALMPAQGGFPQTLGLPVETPLSAPLWSPQGEYLAWGTSQGVYAYHLKKHRLLVISSQATVSIDPNKLYASARQFHHHALWHPLIWHPQGNSLFYVVQEAEFQVLYESTLDRKIIREWYRADGQIMGKAISPDGLEIALTIRHWDGNTGELIRLSLRDETCQQVCQLEDLFYLSVLVAYDTQGRLIYRANHSGYAQLWRQSPATDPQCLDSTPQDVSSYVLSEDQLFFVQASDSFQDLVACLDLNSLEKTLLVPPQKAGLQILAADTAEQTLYLYQSAQDFPGELLAYHWQEATWQTLTYSHPQVWTWPEIQVKDLYIPCPSRIFYPPGFDAEQTYPVLVWLKGGPTSSFQQHYQAWPQHLAQQGYLVVCPNYRGSTGFGVAHMQAGAMGHAGQHDLDDLLALTEWLKVQPYVQAEAMGVLGHSWGGYLTLMMMTRHPGLYACGVASAGIYNWASQQMLEDVRHYSYWLYGGWSRELPERYLERSPLSYAEHVKAPLLLFHGKADQNVPFAQVEAFLKKAGQTDSHLETCFFENEGHSYRLSENRMLFHNQTINFLNKYLKPWNFKDNPRVAQNLE